MLEDSASTEQLPPTPRAYETFFDQVAEIVRHLQHFDGSDVEGMRRVVEAAVKALPPGLLPGHQIGLTDIIASSSLGGGNYPCSATPCRIESAASGARFAALYADRIWIRDPFERLSHHEIDDEEYVEDALASIAAFMEWKPLLLAGVAGHLAPVCVGCASEVVAENGLLSNSVEELSFDLLEELIGSSNATVQRNPNGELNVKLEMPLRYTGHRQTFMYPGGSIETRLAKFLGKRTHREVPKSGRIAFDAFFGIWRPVVNEAVIQALHRGLFNGTYASNLRADLEIASRASADTAQAPIPARVLETIKHTVPIIENVPPSTVMRLRQEDEGSFQLYRSRIASLRNDIQDEKKMREAAEQLRTEFTTLEARIASRKKSVWGGIRDQAKIATGTVGAGVSLWLSHILDPTWTAVVAAAGGLAVAQKVVADALGANRRSSDEMTHPLYFLWKVKKSGQRSLKA